MFSLPDHVAAQNGEIKLHACVQISDTKHDMIDVLDGERFDPDVGIC